MKNLILIRVLVFVSGIIGLGIGLALLLTPITFEASAGIHLDNNASLLSEIRAPGGTLILGGIFTIIGAFNLKITFSALFISGLFHTGYGVARVVGILFDGLPHQTLILAMCVELTVGVLSIMALFYLYFKDQTTQIRVVSPK